VSASNSKGSRGERDLCYYIGEREWTVIRSPTSGSATDREMPDALAANGTQRWAVEAKSRSADRVYIDGEKLAGLLAVAADFSATALLAVKFPVTNDHPAYGEDWPGHMILRLDQVEATVGGNAKVARETALTEGIPLPEAMRYGVDEPRQCGYCEMRPMFEHSDQGRPQCVICSPNVGGADDG